MTDPSSSLAQDISTEMGSYPITFERTLTGQLMVTMNGMDWVRAESPIEYALAGKLDVLEEMDRFLETEEPAVLKAHVEAHNGESAAEAKLSGGRFDYLFDG